MRIRTAEDFERELNLRVLGQEQAVRTVSRYLPRAVTGLKSSPRPAGQFLVVGKTGTGKSLLAESVSQILHEGDVEPLTIECGELHLEHEVAKLKGAPPGYVGFDKSSGLISNAAVKAATSESCGVPVLIFNEIEKAHRSVYSALLGLMDKGKFTPGDNQVVDLSAALIFFTANLGVDEVKRNAAPYGYANETNVTAARLYSRTVEKHFRPEFLNRLDEVVVAQELDAAARYAIAKLEIDKSLTHLEHKVRATGASLSLSYRPEVVAYVLEHGFSAEYQARGLHRFVAREIEALIADRICARPVRRHTPRHLGVSVRDGGVHVQDTEG